MDSESAISRRELAAIGMAAFFHLIGLVGLLYVTGLDFAALTPFNFMVVLSLLFWSRRKSESGFLVFAVVVWLLGFTAEVVGVNTGLLFGNYKYGDALGPKLFDVPLLIGVNWLLVLLGSRVWANSLVKGAGFRSDSVVVVAELLVGAALATAFDWVMEPAAIHLGYWSWQSGEIPFWNYTSWFLVCILMLIIGRFRPFSTRDPYAAYLLIIQLLFFIVLRLFWGLY